MTDENYCLHWVKWCPGADSNHRHADFQSAALPTELPGQIAYPRWMGFCEERDPSLMDIAAHKATVQPEFTEKFHPLPALAKCDHTVPAPTDQPATHGHAALPNRRPPTKPPARSASHLWHLYRQSIATQASDPSTV